MGTRDPGPQDAPPPLRGPADPDEAGRLPGEGDEPFAWGREPAGPRKGDRKDLHGMLAFTAAMGLFGFAHWVALVMVALGAAPIIVLLVKDARTGSRGVCRVVVEPGPARRITLHRADGRVAVRSLDDVRRIQPLLVGYTGGETDGVRVLEIRIGRRRYRTDSHHSTDDSQVTRLAAALGRACPEVPVRRLEDKRYRLTPD